MMLTLHTETTIDSCHKLDGYDGKCKNLHGHTWKVELWFRGEENLKDKVGILVDFGIVKELKDLLDHKYLNDVIVNNPTAENLTIWTYLWLANKINNNQINIRVRIYETAVDKLTYCESGDF
jgi:6-pyruvoyltetrahydropterin/6-carboxytetrahydropterin synthase